MAGDGVNAAAGPGPPRVVITNAVPLNGGDAAILQGLVQGIRRRFGADTPIVAFSSQADVAARRHAALDVDFRESLSSVVANGGRIPAGARERKKRKPVRRDLSQARFDAAFALASRGVPGAAAMLTPLERELVDLFRGADFVVATGGTYLVDNYALRPRLREFRVAMRLGRPLALFTQTMGPFGPRRAAQLRPVFEYSSLLLLRDQPSFENVRATGARDVTAAVVADVAFTLGDEASVAAARERTLPADRPLRVAASVRDWPFFRTRSPEEGMRAIVDSFARLSEHLSRRGAHVEFASTCQGIPEYWKDDSRVAAAVAQAATVDDITVDAGFRMPDALMEHYRSFDLVVSMRMHACILALAAGVPVLPVAYETKTKSLFQRLGFGDWVLDVETLTPESLIETCDRVLAELPARRAALFDAVLAEMRSAEHGLDLLADAIRAATAAPAQRA